MRKLSRRVCSHTEPPPPEGRGQKYDICFECVVPVRKRIAKKIGNSYGQYDHATDTWTFGTGRPVMINDALQVNEEYNSPDQIRLRKFIFKLHRREFRHLRDTVSRENRARMRRMFALQRKRELRESAS